MRLPCGYNWLYQGFLTENPSKLGKFKIYVIAYYITAGQADIYTIE